MMGNENSFSAVTNKKKSFNLEAKRIFRQVGDNSLLWKIIFLGKLNCS